MSIFQGLFSSTGSKSSLFDTNSAFFASSAAPPLDSNVEYKPKNNKRNREAAVAADNDTKVEKKRKVKKADKEAKGAIGNDDAEDDSDVKKKKRKERKSEKTSMQEQVKKVAKAIQKTNKQRQDDDAAEDADQDIEALALEESKPGEEDEEQDEEEQKSALDPVTKKAPPSAAEQAEKLKRTIFVGNVKVTKTTRAKLQRFFSANGSKVESVRLRSLAFQAEAKGDRRVKALQGKVDQARAVAHAYVVFEDAASVEPALSLNNSIFEGLHLRVDRASMPSKKVSAAKKSLASSSDSSLDPSLASGPQHYDSSRSLFVGNLPFHCKDEDLISLFSDKSVAPELDGCIEAVRVVRDPATQIGKGFAFVLFRSKASLRVALHRSEGWTVNKRALRLTRVNPSTTTPLRAKHRELSSAEGGGGGGPGGGERQAPKPLSAFAASFSKQKSRFASKALKPNNASKNAFSNFSVDSRKNEDWQGLKTKGKSKGIRGPKESVVNKAVIASGAGGGGKGDKKSEKRPSVANRKLKEKGLPLKPIPKPLKGSGSKGKRGGQGGKRPRR